MSEGRTEIQGCYCNGGIIGLAQNLVTVKGSFWTYNDGGDIWYFPAFGDYYTDLYYDEAITATGERIAYGICHKDRKSVV